MSHMIILMYLPVLYHIIVKLIIVAITLNSLYVPTTTSGDSCHVSIEQLLFDAIKVLPYSRIFCSYSLGHSVAMDSAQMYSYNIN